MQQYQLQAQIKAITKAIEQGKVKNVYAANGKVRQLQKQLEKVQWNNFLAQ